MKKLYTIKPLSFDTVGPFDPANEEPLVGCRAYSNDGVYWYDVWQDSNEYDWHLDDCEKCTGETFATEEIAIEAANKLNEERVSDNLIDQSETIQDIFGAFKDKIAELEERLAQSYIKCIGS